jgi:aspartyl-tRNA synthetase
VKARGYEIPRTDGDLDPEGERQISAHVEETYGHQFVFITDYHPEIRPFYHMRDAETGLTKSYDLLFRGTEITTGAARAPHRRARGAGPGEGSVAGGPRPLPRLLPLRVPPGGFGMGQARLLMLLLGQDSIREVTYLFRGPTRLAP